MTLSRLLRSLRPADEPDRPRSGFRSVARTHIGRVRTVNEDRVLDCPERGLWAVADGMGGHSAGDVAATAAIDALHALVRDDAPIDRAAITDAIGRSNSAIHHAASTKAHVSGSTIAGLFRDGADYLVFWVGDSRVYRKRGTMFEPLTRDHSMVQELVDAGTLSPDEAARHPRANVITRALGVGPEVAIEFAAGTAEPGDIFLVCSDGLSSLVPAAMLSYLLDQPIEDACAALLDAALKAGGSDNISLIAIRGG